MDALLKRLCFILMISTFFFACEDEPASLIDIPEALIGQWRQVSEVNANCPNPNNNGTEAKDCTTENCLEYTFDVNGTVTRRAIENGSRIVEVNKFTLDEGEIFVEKGLELDIFTYELFEDQLNLIYRDSRTRCTIIQVFTMN